MVGQRPIMSVMFNCDALIPFFVYRSHGAVRAVNEDGLEISRRRRSSRLAFVEDAHFAELLVALFEQLFHWDLLQVAQIAQKIALEDVPHLPRVAVGAAQWFGNNVVDDTQVEKVARGQLERDLFNLRIIDDIIAEPAQPSGLMTE